MPADRYAFGDFVLERQQQRVLQRDGSALVLTPRLFDALLLLVENAGLLLTKDSLMLALGGGLLVLPGFISDAAGLLLLFPPVRRFLVNRLRKRAEEQAIRQRAFADDFEAAARPRSQQPLGREPNVIEGEFEHRDK